MVRLRAALVVTALGAGCADAPWVQDARPPEVTSIVPNSVASGAGGHAAVQGNNLKPGYNAYLDRETPLIIRIGDREVVVEELEPSGTRAVVTVPLDLPAGLYTVTAQNGYGEGHLDEALEVRADSAADAGHN